MAGDDSRRGNEKRRLAERRSVACDAILHVPGRSATVRVQDLSPRGAGLASPNPPSVGARVHIEFPALLGRPTVDAVVRHASRRDRHMGVEFDHAGETASKVAEQLVRATVAGEDA
jgi:hypothetical protein